MWRRQTTPRRPNRDSSVEAVPSRGTVGPERGALVEREPRHKNMGVTWIGPPRAYARHWGNPRRWWHRGPITWE